MSAIIFVTRSQAGETLCAKIAEDWTNFDALGLMQQLGLIPEQQ